MLLHYLAKRKIRNFALFVHVKHVSAVTFYHLSNRQQPASMGFGLYWQPAIVFFTLANEVHSFIQMS